MLMSSLPGLFVTGTDTGVGKTRVSAAIAASIATAGRRVGVLKPVATGAVLDSATGVWHSEDTDLLIDAIGTKPPTHQVTPIVFEAPLAPPVAARLAGTLLTSSRLEADLRSCLDWWVGPGEAEVVVVEGVGGLLCPLTEDTTVADLAVSLEFPLIIVARRALGTLNHTLLTVEAAKLRGLRIAGIILNGADPTTDPVAEATNPAELARWIPDVPILGEIEHQPSGMYPDSLDLPLLGLDWSLVAATSRLDLRSLEG